MIYRDGVGDGQLNVSAEYEVPQFESCFRHVSPDYHPKLTVIVCQKRINTRIFAMLVSPCLYDKYIYMCICIYIYHC